MKVCSRVCGQCPFRTNSAPRWLGSNTVDDIKEAISMEIPFSCHIHRKEDSTLSDISSGKLPICRGFLASATKSYKLFGRRDKELAKLQRQVDSDSIEEEEDILDLRQFIKHHSE